VLKSYVDASLRKDSGLVCVAAYLVESGRVRRFRQRWRDTFGNESFSWADLIARAKPFTHLRDNQPEHDRLVAAGVALIRENVLAGSVVSCWRQDIENFSPTWIRGFGHAYSVAGHMAIAGMQRAAERRGFKGGISYVIESGDEGYDQLNHLLSNAAKSPEVRAMYQWGNHEVIPKTACSPFHGPDLFAWEWGKYWTEIVVQRKRPMRLSLVSLLQGHLDHYFFQHLGGDPLLRFLSRIRDLGIDQLQEDAAASASVSGVDLSGQVQTLEHGEEQS